MHTNRTYYLLIVMVILVFPACARQVTETPLPAQAPESTLRSIPPTVVELSKTAVPIADRNIEGMFDVGGRELYLKCEGSGSPTIVLEPGEGGTVTELTKIQDMLAQRTMTSAYDRANNGLSNSAPTPRTAADVAQDLNALLESAQIPGPYLLVGSSAGGMMVQLYARLYPEEISGVVAINPVPPAHPWLDEVSQIFTAEEYAGEEAYYQGDNGESFDYLTSSEQLTASPIPPDLPFEVLLSTSVQCEGDGICLKSYSTYEQLVRDVTTAWPRGNYTQVESLHNIFDEIPDAVVSAVERILASL